MSTEDRNDLVGDVADALTLDQKVQWERCARLAAGADREKIENLRVIERVLAIRPAAGQASESAEATRTYGSAVVRRAVHVLIAIATIEVAATLLLLPWAWGDYLREHGEVAVFMTTKFVGHAAAAGLLLWAGRGDWRTWLLGVYCLLKATHAPLHMLPAFVLELPPPQEYAAYLQHLPADSRLLLALHVPAFLFAPAFLWAFAREYPRVHRRTRLDDLARRMIPASVLIGGGLWVACAVTLELARAAAPVALVLDGTIAMQDLLVLGAVTVIALRAHTAPADEARRVVVFSAGFLLLMGLSAVYNVAEALAPGDWVSNYRWSPTVLLMEVLRFPGLVLLWYAVLAARIPHLREAVRVFYRRLLLHPGLLGAVAAVPAGALAWHIGRSPERTVGAVIADPLAGLAGLEALDLAGNRISDVWGPGYLTRLERLNLADNAIEDLRPLARLTLLEVLLLDRNRITDVLELSPMAELANLGLAGNPIANLWPLEGLGQLHRLDLSGNAAADPSALGRVENLRWLWLDPAPAAELEAAPGQDSGPRIIVVEQRGGILRNPLPSDADRKFEGNGGPQAY